ncbi:hypothetical protein [Pedobacter rhodius]|uniref:Uncharacterized protein n=1 Tax=Pedobacter rhodius TaxID=3004098 RepID=A0ABT4KUP1_9SPHI|nr:hypothetical protein [Pedobacter sp. SJ11]MCZ4222633.1 hypothetical protein [Pedobacter sp. SJ11]
MRENDDLRDDKVPNYYAFPSSRLFCAGGNPNAKYRVKPAPWSLAYRP